MWSIRNIDPDGDGYSTLVEVTDTASYTNTPTFPGLTAANVGSVLNIPLGEVQSYVMPTAGGDTTPPTVIVSKPNGGEGFVANRATNITWTATDASGVASVSIYVSLDNGLSYRPVVMGLPNTGTYSWFPANRPTTTARIRIVAVDNALNSGQDQSDGPFSIISPPGGRAPTTLRDFDMPGSQPFESGPPLEASTDCASCHGNYSSATEPYFNWRGSMMAHASRDLLFQANMTIANQDAPDSGDLCLRCHLSRGWQQGRSIPTDGSQMTAADGDGVSCALCHRMVDPVYESGVSPTNDLGILAALLFSGTNFGNGMVVIDPTSTRRGPFTNTASPHAFLPSPFHREAALCGTCHDVSNPAFNKDAQGKYVANTFDSSATNFSPHSMLPVERTYSEWLASEYNSPAGVFAPQFAGNKTNGMVSTCQDCHMRDVSGRGCDPAQFPSVPTRADLPLHDMTGGSTWLPAMLTNLYPTEVNAAAIQAGIARATYLLTNAATLAVVDANGQLKVTVTNQCGHKLPTGYPEGRRVWLNVRFYDEEMNLLSESGAYTSTNGVLEHDTEVKIYEIHPGIETNLALALGLAPGPSFHFVLNNQVFSDNRIPPRGFSNASFALFGGAPVDHSYADGQYWDDTFYSMPPGTTRAEVRLYYQSTSKEFIEFLRDENTTNTKGQEIYDLWRTNGMCPPTMMAEAVWVPVFVYKTIHFTTQGTLQMHFLSRPGTTYTVEYTDDLNGVPVWHNFQNNGSFVATDTESMFEDDFTANTSGGPSATGSRFYRFSYNGAP